MLWNYSFEPVKVSFDDISKLHAKFALQIDLSIGLAEEYIKRSDSFGYRRMKHEYEEAIEMLGLHLFDCMPSRDEECKKHFPEWEESDYSEVPFFSSDLEFGEEVSFATGTDDDVPF